MDQGAMVNEVEIDSWETFLYMVSEMESGPDEFVYRGQKDCSWSLRPSLARIWDCFCNAMETERHISAVFMRRSTTLLSSNIFGELSRHNNILHSRGIRRIPWI